MLTPRDIELLLRLVDAGIEAELSRICNAPVPSKEYATLFNAEDEVLAKDMGIKL